MALEEHKDIKISNNEILGKVEFILPSNSKVTTPDIIQSLKKQNLLPPKTITQTIIPPPKHQYLIILKQTPIDDNACSYTRQVIRTLISKKLSCDKVFFKENIIEIWSSKELSLDKLGDEQLITTQRSVQKDKKAITIKSPFGGGIQSVKKVEK